MTRGLHGSLIALVGLLLGASATAATMQGLECPAKTIPLSPGRTGVLIVGDTASITMQSLPPGTKSAEAEAKGEALEQQETTGSLLTGYTFLFKAVKGGDAVIVVTITHKEQDKDVTWSRDVQVKVFEPKDIAPVTVAAVAQQPQKYTAQLVLFSGTGRGWGKPEKAKEVLGTLVTRSDWTFEDDTGAVHVTGIRYLGKAVPVSFVGEIIEVGQGEVKTWAVRADRLLRRAKPAPR